ncbi:hypothetical protein [Olleya sp. HaHaR_3_96]|uniref:hypothetical protein n=1 Tax=Olleya sp. HaHaR_3_96 TaxID=2745560 RepID=UPI001C4F7501|nr:hypothetical protein [Olleya sp. HaHaR_3_96]QXP59230.1 hypothetical protein H0I26_15070 [Olleya sp. HaHaR_3_96]
MRTFNDIYNNIQSNFSPQPRSIIDLGIILSKLYEVLKSDKYSEYNPFELNSSSFSTDRTTIERLIYELENAKSDNRIHTVSSEAIERLIADVKTLEINVKNPNTDSSNSNMFDFTYLKGQLLYLIDISREGLVLNKKQKIIDTLEKLDNKTERINYLNSTLLEIAQNKNFWDKNQFEHITKFLELEISKWEKYIEPTEGIDFKSPSELHKFIVKLISERLIHNIRYLEGYKVFWRDESSSLTPKKETEIQHFIKSILKPYCDTQKIKIHRESAIANGQIDMTFTYLNHSVCLEIKKAQHQDILKAVNSQLTEYMIGEETEYGIYMVLWYKTESGYQFPKAHNNVDDLICSIEIESDTLKYEIIGVDCSKPN